MTNKTAAMRYARALLDVGIKERADLDQIERDLASVAELFTQYPALAHALLNAVVPVSRKRAAVAELLAGAQLTPMVGKLLTLLADRDRLVLVPDLLAGYRDRLSNIATSSAPKSPQPLRFPRIGRRPSRPAWRVRRAVRFS